MNKMMGLAVLVVLSGSSASARPAVIGQQTNASPVLGEWIGQSKCVGNRAACNDEESVYVITPAETADVVWVNAYKIINGSRVLMGGGDYHYDAATRHLTWDVNAGQTHGRWDFVVTGATLDGTLTLLPDQTVVRRVKLRKANP